MKNLKIYTKFLPLLLFIKSSFAGISTSLFGSGFSPTVINSSKSPSAGLLSIFSNIKSQTGWIWYLAIFFIVSAIIGLFFNHNENILKMSAKIIATLVIVALIVAVAATISTGASSQ